jgi:DNA-binding MarR family transcriptional regulator
MNEPRTDAGGLEALAYDLSEATTAVRRVSRRALRTGVDHEALPHAQVEVLVTVVESPGIGVAETARALGVAPNTVSTLVGQLVRAGLIARTEDLEDRRAAVLLPTTAGRARVRRWRQERSRLVSHALGRLSPDDRHRIHAAVGPIRRLAEAMVVQLEEGR